MKTVLIVAGIIVFLVYGFVLYCCIKVGKESDEQYNKLREVTLIGVILSIFLSILKRVKKYTGNEWKEKYTSR